MRAGGGLPVKVDISDRTTVNTVFVELFYWDDDVNDWERFLVEEVPLDEPSTLEARI